MMQNILELNYLMLVTYLNTHIITLFPITDWKISNTSFVATLQQETLLVMATCSAAGRS